MKIIILSFESRHKVEGQNVVPHTKSEEKKNVIQSLIFSKIS